MSAATGGREPCHISTVLSCPPPFQSLPTCLLKMFILICRLLGIGRISVKRGTTGAKALLVSICHYLTKDRRVRAMAAFCLSPELLQGPRAQQAHPQWVVLAGLCRVNSSEILRESIPLPATICHKTRNILHTAVHKASTFQIYCATKIKGITNDLGCWSSRDFTQLPCKGRPKSNHITPTNPLNPECRSKVHTQSTRKGFSASCRGHSLPSNSPLAPAAPRIKPCHAGLVL